MSFFKTDEKQQENEILSLCRKTPGWVMREPVGGTYVGKCVVFNMNGPQTQRKDGNWDPAVVAFGNNWTEVHEVFKSRNML